MENILDLILTCELLQNEKAPTHGAPRSGSFKMQKSVCSETLSGGALKSFPQWRGREVVLLQVQSQLVNMVCVCIWQANSFIFLSHMYVYE